MAAFPFGGTFSEKIEISSLMHKIFHATRIQLPNSYGNENEVTFQLLGHFQVKEW